MLYFLNICIHTYIHYRISNRFEIFNDFDFKILRFILKQLHFLIIFFYLYFYCTIQRFFFHCWLIIKENVYMLVCVYRKLLLQFAGYQEIIDKKSQSKKVTKFEFLALDYTGIRNGISFMVFIISGYKKYRYIHNLCCR